WMTPPAWLFTTTWNSLAALPAVFLRTPALLNVGIPVPFRRKSASPVASNVAPARLLITGLVLPSIHPVLAHVMVPLLLMVRALRTLVLPVVKASEPDAPMLVEPVPDMVPPVQEKAPETASAALPPSVPLVSEALVVDADALKLAVPPMTSVAPM